MKKSIRIGCILLVLLLIVWSTGVSALAAQTCDKNSKKFQFGGG